MIMLKINFKIFVASCLIFLKAMKMIRMMISMILLIFRQRIKESSKDKFWCLLNMKKIASKKRQIFNFIWRNWNIEYLRVKWKKYLLSIVERIWLIRKKGGVFLRNFCHLRKEWWKGISSINSKNRKNKNRRKRRKRLLKKKKSLRSRVKLHWKLRLSKLKLWLNLWVIKSKTLNTLKTKLKRVKRKIEFLSDTIYLLRINTILPFDTSLQFFLFFVYILIMIDFLLWYLFPLQYFIDCFLYILC